MPTGAGHLGPLSFVRRGCAPIAISTFAALLAACSSAPANSTPPTPLRGTLEVIQSIGLGTQGPNTRFVAGKDAAVVVRLEAAAAVDPAQQQVIVTRDGNRVATLSPQPSDAPTSTLVFVCPSRDACQGWRAGTYAFTARIGGAEATASNVVFRERRALRVLAVPLRARYTNDVKVPLDDKWKSAAAFTQRVYPLGQGSLSYTVRDQILDVTSLDIQREADTCAIWRLVASLNPPECANNPAGASCYDFIAGFVKEPIPALDGNGMPTGFLTNGYTCGRPAIITNNDSPEMPKTFAHELGHTFGTGDEYNGGQYNCDLNPPPPAYMGTILATRMPGGCPQSMSRDWAMRMGSMGTGTLWTSDQLHAFEIGGRGLIGADLSVFMGSGGSLTDYWISPAIYERIFDQLDPALPLMTQGAGPVVEIEGIVHRTGNGETITLQPFQSYQGAQPATPGTAAQYTARAVDGGGQTLASQNLDVDFNPYDEPIRTVQHAAFTATLAFPAETAKIQILKDGVVQSEVAVSATAPTVAVTAPAAGATLAGVNMVTWTAGDADNQPLTYDVQYSDDAGATWQVLQTDLTTTALAVDFDHLPGGDSALVQVIASDGVRSARAMSGAFKVAAKKPAPLLYQPAAGAAFKVGAEVTLSGDSEDSQDAEIPDSGLVWSSDRDGKLGSGGLLFTSALTAGPHQITLTVTNSKGLSSAATVAITVNP